MLMKHDVSVRDATLAVPKKMVALICQEAEQLPLSKRDVFQVGSRWATQNRFSILESCVFYRVWYLLGGVPVYNVSGVYASCSAIEEDQARRLQSVADKEAVVMDLACDATQGTDQLWFQKYQPRR